MAEVVRETTMAVPVSALYQTITNFENYPKFLAEVVSAKRLSPADPHKARIQFEIEVVKSFVYVLDFTMKPETEISWKLVESDFFKSNQGKWVLAPQGKNTQVNYSLEVAFGFLVPGWISRKLTEVSLPKMFESFEAEAKKHG